MEAENKVKEALQSCKARADALLEDKARLKEQNRVQVLFKSQAGIIGQTQTFDCISWRFSNTPEYVQR